MTNTKITYTQQGDYLLPDLKLPEKPKVEIGIFGKRHLRYLERNRKILYTNLLTKGKLTAYLADIDEQAENMFGRLVRQLAEREGVTEQLKANNQMLWVKKMNSIRNRAEEIVNHELIYSCEVKDVSVKTVEAWEAGTNKPIGAARRFLSVLKVDPKLLVKNNIISA